MTEELNLRAEKLGFSVRIGTPPFTAGNLGCFYVVPQTAAASEIESSAVFGPAFSLDEVEEFLLKKAAEPVT